MAGTETLSLTGLTDSVLGFETDFRSFSLPSILNLSVNLPTGNTGWETQQSNSIVPTQFIDSDYRGRGFGMSLLYGLAFQAGKEQYGVAAGYLYSGAFNPYYGQAASPVQLKLGDSLYLSANHTSDHGGGESDVIRLSAFYFLPTMEDGSNLLQMGPNLNASYGWNNPRGFSFEAGGQYFMPILQPGANGQLSAEPYSSFGPRFYFNPSYSWGDLLLAGRVKYNLANGYPPNLSNGTPNPLYDGGGILAGLEPSYKLKLDSASFLKFSASYDYVVYSNGSYDTQGDRVNIEYGHWTVGTQYEAHL